MKYPSANKELGQHFLRDGHIIKKITEDFKESAEAIIEVGPGPGVLTKNLGAHKLPFYVIEKDERFPELLKEHLPEENIFLEDALKFDWDSFLTKYDLADKKIWLVSNLPYNISVPLLMGFMKNKSIKFMTLMFQKEVGEKSYFQNDKKNQMNSLLALSLTFFETKLLCKVLPGAFNPPPKVDSVVVSYKRLENPVIDFSDFLKFESFLRLIFSQKRKQLQGILKSALTKEKLEILWEKTKITPNIRAEALTLADIHNLFKEFKNLQ